MKTILRLLLGFSLAGLAGTNASAQVLAKDDATSYATWTNGMNLGFGFNGWTLLTTNVGGFAGFFTGDGSVIATGGLVWGLFGNETATNPPGNAAVAHRAFTNSLPTNTVFKIKWHNNGVGLDPLGLAGLSLRNGNAGSSVTDFHLLNDTSVRFAFYYPGAQDDQFRIIDSEIGRATGLGFGTGPFELNLILLSPDTYRLVVKNPGATTVITNYDGTLAGSGTIDSVALFNYQCDGNQVFNSMEISPTSLIPPDIQSVQPTNNSAFLSAGTAISFDVMSEFSGVSTNNIALTLNGTNITGLSFSGSTTNWSVSKSGALAANASYVAIITVTDLNGNKRTNTFTFNTWSATNPYIDGEDYNYSSGGFNPNAFPAALGTYSNAATGIGLLGTNGVDYLEYDTAGTNNAYRPQDLPQVELSGDIDHANYTGFGVVNYNVGFIQNGEWLNYTRRMSNTHYAVYARMAGFGNNNPVMLFERLANPTATSSNQPRAALGTFVCPQTGGVQTYTFVPLRDFFSNPLTVRFAGTNTFRCTAIGGSGAYNLDYLTFVPVASTALRPYLSAGYPYPGAGPVEPDETISFTIANRETTVMPGTIQLFVNNVNVTSGIVTSNNAAGCVVTYVPTSYHPSGGTSTVSVVYTDSGSTTQTNTWQFTVANVPVISATYALASGSAANRGFNIRVAKATNAAPAEAFPKTSTRAENHLAGLITNANTGQPYFNEAGGPGGNGRYAETNVINYNQAIGFADSGIAGDVNFPYVAQSLNGSYTNDPNNFSMEAIAYAHLSPGIYKWAVRSDDGFRLWFGTGANPTNQLVAEFEGGRSDATASEFEFIVPIAGVYPFRLLYYEGDGLANCELYSINRTNGQAVLINDLANSSAVVTYRDVPVVLFNPTRSGGTSTFKFLTQAGRTHTVLYKNDLTNGAWVTLQTVAGTGAVTNITDVTASGPRRFYRVSTE